MRSPPANPPAFTNPRVIPASAPDLRAVEIRYRDGELYRKGSQGQADAIVANGFGSWKIAANGRQYIKLEIQISEEARAFRAWLRPAIVIRARLRRDAPGF